MSTPFILMHGQHVARTVQLHLTCRDPTARPSLQVQPPEQWAGPYRHPGAVQGAGPQWQFLHSGATIHQAKGIPATCSAGQWQHTPVNMMAVWSLLCWRPADCGITDLQHINSTTVVGTEAPL